MNDNLSIKLFIVQLAKLEPGERARLKRCVGQTLNETRELSLFYQLLPSNVPEYDEELYFLVATLYPMAENTNDGDFGDSLYKARNDKNYKGLDRRVQALLDSDENQLAYRLLQTIYFINSRPEQIKINWKKLLEDLLMWKLQDRSVQRRWARNYFAK